MELTTAMAIAALVGSVLLLESRHRSVAMLAVIASGIEVAVSLRMLTMSVTGVKLSVVLGAILAVTGAVILARATRKLPIAAATAVALVGCLQVLVLLDLVSG